LNFVTSFLDEKKSKHKSYHFDINFNQDSFNQILSNKHVIHI